VKDIKTLLLAMLSLGLVGTWIYHLYDKTQYSSRRTEVYIKDSVAVAEGIKDSLQKLYVSTIINLDTRLDSTRSNADSLKSQLNVKLGEIYKLKSEIDGILKNRGASKADLDIARQKITELQQLIDDLKGEKDSMEEEKKQLNNILSQLSGEITGLQQNMKKLGDENKALTEKVNLASVFVASEVKLSPVTVKNDKEQETNQAKKVTKLIASFTVQNNVNEYANADVYVVVIQPNGKVLRTDAWESFSMDTYNGNKIPYTRKLRFEYNKGEAKHMIFSLDAEDYQKGNYTLQVYHNGYMVGQTVKTLI
jgi:predicted  nucleic acid-binding Zn-ribbon protein